MQKNKVKTKKVIYLGGGAISGKRRGHSSRANCPLDPPMDWDVQLITQHKLTGSGIDLSLLWLMIN